MTLIDYLQAHAIRCAPEEGDADVVFFGVRKGPDATADALKAAIAKHKGEFCEVNPMDGAEHNYIELGAWVGDQGAALTLIGLGAALGAWKLLTPGTLLGDLCPPNMVLEMAGMGMVAMQAMQADGK